ncbi:peptide/nickel transport system substrate-binding protein [Allocatelliglobosispora scoriae]|uniref:Peptide/nickel transport system substrate-binding protein n=1 Tax=Allocatelliglobosispora scoriae TaxID=643052 RepID=A0A841BTW1_9ACTN|nr:ABC transporter substrate-binding protein [Allocatelliglobosispora scoriae]MBB5870182.1 peptide/nickel transport system substrate-binding protein [Allocatelliglobosispora scoriae]
MVKRLAAVVAVAMAALGALALPAQAEPTPSGEPAKKTFIVGIKQDIDSLNPYVGVVAAAFESYQLNYDALTFSSDNDFSPVPGLAESWDTSADGKTWTYHLRKGVKWSDGRDLTAEDVVYTFNRVINGETENGQYGNYLTKATKVSKTDDNTVVITTSEPTPIMLRLAIPILPKHIWEKVDAKAVATFPNDTKVVGSGPFILSKASKGVEYRFAANKSYWAGAPKFDELIFRVFADDEPMKQALVKGEIDMAEDLSSAVFESLKGVDGVTVNDATYYGFSELGYNLGAQTVDGKKIGDGHPALTDKQVRIAIDTAIDRKVLVDKVLRGHGTAATGVIPPIYSQFHWNPGSAERAFDLAKANSLLDAAGWAKGSDGIRAKNGKQLKLRFFARDSSENSKQDAEYIREWLKEIGIEVNVSIMSEDNLTTVLGKGEFDLFDWGWVVEPDPDFQLSVMTCDQRSTIDKGNISAGWSDSFYCNPEFDKLYDEQKTIIDPIARAEVVKKAQKLLYDDVAYSMLYYYNQFEAYRSDRFTGFRPQPSAGGLLAFQFGTWSYRNIEPATGGDDASDGLDVLVTIAIVGGVLLLAGGVFVVIFMRRKRGTSLDDVE